MAYSKELSTNQKEVWERLKHVPSAKPVYSFGGGGDSDTGFYASADDTLTLVTSGIEAFRIDAK